MPNQIRIPAVQVAPQQADSGGSSLGGILGAIVGAAATVATAGAAAPLTVGSIAGGLSGGMALGGLAGGIIDKPEAGRSGGAMQVPEQQSDDSFVRRFQGQSADNVQENTYQKYASDLASGLKASLAAPPQVQQQVIPPMMQAFKQLHDEGRLA